MDDTHTMELNFYRARKGDEYDRPNEGPATVTNRAGRSYEEMQREPGDFEAQIGQRPIAVHAMEHLTTTDRGVTMVRKMIKEGIRSVQRGEDPKGIRRDAVLPIPTYANETVMHIPPASSQESDRKLVAETGKRVIKNFLTVPPVQKSHGLSL